MTGRVLPPFMQITHFTLSYNSISSPTSAVPSGSGTRNDAHSNRTFIRPSLQVSDRPSASHDSKMASQSQRITPIDGSSMGAKLTLIFASTKEPLSVLRMANASSCVRFIALRMPATCATTQALSQVGQRTRSPNSPPRHPLTTVVHCHSHQRILDDSTMVHPDNFDIETSANSSPRSLPRSERNRLSRRKQRQAKLRR